MRLILIKNDSLNSIIIPDNIWGNYWITDIDENNKNRNLVNIESQNGEWKLKSNFEVSVFYAGTEVNISSKYQG